MKSRLVETSMNGRNRTIVVFKEKNKQLSRRYCTGTFTGTLCGECRFIQLVNMSRNHIGTDNIWIYAREIFAVLVG
jgi:hypothetical protein